MIRCPYFIRVLLGGRSSVSTSCHVSTVRTSSDEDSQPDDMGEQDAFCYGSGGKPF